MHLDSDTSEKRFRHTAILARFGMLAWLVAMFVGTHIPGQISHEISQHDKLMHFWAYMTLAFLVAANWDLSVGRLQRYQYLLIWLVCAIYGALDELLQIPVGRSCEAMDWLFDIAGAAAGLILFRLLRPVIYRVALLLPAAART